MTFEEVARKSQQALKQALISELGRIGYKTHSKKGFTYGAGSLPVLLVAHLDTVHRNPVKTICYSQNGRILMSPQGIGGDDRAGVYMILEIIRRRRCHVLFCEDEEIGGIGARRFVKSNIRPDINYIIELDRHGENDAFFYDCDNREFTDFVCGYGLEEAFGSFSDISIIAPHLGIAAVNISAGYYNEHTLHEYVNMDVMEKNIERVEKMVSTPSGEFAYIAAKRVGTKGLFDQGRRIIHNRWLDDFDWVSDTKEPKEIRQLKVAAEQFGVSDIEVDLLLDCGYFLDDIEMLLNFPQEMRRAIYEAAFG